MHDIIGKDAKNLLYVENIIAAIMEKYNFQYLITPILEKAELESIKSDNLRPSGRIGAIRKYLENKSIPLKLWYCGPMFEKEETYQWGLEVLGGSSPTIDVEVISLVGNFYKLLGLEKYTLKINTKGNKEHLEKVQEYLNNLEIDYVIDEDLDINSNDYDDLFFEFITDIDELDNQLVIGCGGRYSYSVNGNNVLGFGFSLNLSNLLETLHYDGFIYHENEGLNIFVTYTKPTYISFALDLTQVLRMNGFNVEFDHLHNGNNGGAKFTIIIDDKCINDNLITIIHNKTQEQEEIDGDYIINYLDEKVSDVDEEDLY